MGIFSWIRSAFDLRSFKVRDNAGRVVGAARPVGSADDVPDRRDDSQVRALPLFFRPQRRPLDARRIQVGKDPFSSPIMQPFQFKVLFTGFGHKICQSNQD